MRTKSYYGLILAMLIILARANSFAQTMEVNSNPSQKIIIIMLDGFGEDYYRNSDMPTLNYMEHHGIYKVVPSLMPSVTNVNNASIITGEYPAKHGITGNSFYNTATSKEEFMEDENLVLAETVFERARRHGVSSILFSSKKKTVNLLKKGTDEAVSPETAASKWIDRIGIPPGIYSCEVNYWLMKAALFSIRNDSTKGITYIHTTDYPMHTWAPESVESKKHLHKIDSFIADIIKAAPGAMLLITADHNVKHKSLCWDIEKACAARNTPVKIAISPERDKYFLHHRGFGGTSYVYLKQLGDATKVKRTLLTLKGIRRVLSREEAAREFHLMPERIGDLMILGDENTVFGDLDTELELLPPTYRSHGSEYEAMVPVFIYNARNAPGADYFTENYKIASWLFR